MTHAEAIKELNDMLAHLRALLSNNYEHKEMMQKHGQNAKKDASILLTKIGSKKVGAVSRLSFDSDANRSDMRESDYSYCQKINICFQNGVNTLIDILQDEVNIQQHAVEEDCRHKALAEQQKSNAIQYKAFWCSIAATIISLIALIVAICE